MSFHMPSEVIYSKTLSPANLSPDGESPTTIKVIVSGDYIMTIFEDYEMRLAIKVGRNWEGNRSSMIEDAVHLISSESADSIKGIAIKTGVTVI